MLRACQPRHSRVALVFSGQGSQRKGMCAAFTAQRESAPWHRCLAADHWSREHHSFSLSSAMQDDPPRMAIDGCAEVAPERGTGLRGGMLNVTHVTQPALLAFHMAALDALLVKAGEGPCLHAHRPAAGEPAGAPVDAAAVSGGLLGGSVAAVAGHSLGEFSAAHAIGLIPRFDDALELVYCRGRAMAAALEAGGASAAADGSGHAHYSSYACDPRRAGVSEDEFAVLVELTSRIMGVASRRMLEVQNHNIRGSQIVVAGDGDSLSVLGKCLDPQWRATALASAAAAGQAPADGSGALQALVRAAVRDMLEDHALGIAATPAEINAPPLPGWVPGSKYRGGPRTALMHRRDLTPDGGATLPEERLGSLTRQGQARSGLKKRSWFLPLHLAAPFHTSALRMALDALHPLVLERLASSDDIDRVCRAVAFVPNLTGMAFDAASADFRREALEAIESLNVGEQDHVGRAQPAVLQRLAQDAAQGDSRELLAAVLTAQLCKTVQWADVMAAVTGAAGCSSVVEVAPAATLSEMFRKAAAAAEGSAAIDVATVPRDADRVAAAVTGGPQPRRLSHA